MCFHWPYLKNTDNYAKASQVTTNKGGAWFSELTFPLNMLLDFYQYICLYIYIKREVYMYLSRGDLLEHRGKHQRPFNSTERYSMLKKRKKLVDKEKAIWMHGLKPKVNNYTFDFYSSSFIFFLCNLKSFKNSSLINQINRFPFKSNFRMANSSKTHFFPIICRNYVKWTVASSLY